jgi:flagellar biosynthetic protein FliQ
MTPDLAIQAIRDSLMMAFWLAAPILIAGLVAGVLLSLVQIVTSIQDTAFSTVPRLAVFLAATVVSMPWIFNKAMSYFVSILGNLNRYGR